MQLLARLSLSFLWFFTGITSIFFGKEIGYQVLAGADIIDPLAGILVLSGSVLDLVIGIWVLVGWKLRTCCLVQILVIVIYTLLLSYIDVSYWFHPFGPLTKNIPLIALIYILYSSDLSTKTSG